MLSQDLTNKLDQLKAGNNRYTNGFTENQFDQFADKRKQLTNGQNPWCSILTCADSRVPAELIFDQSLGDLFVIRLAGNFTSTEAIASLEYATLNLGTNLIVMMAHTHCGAIKATQDYLIQQKTLPTQSLNSLVTSISELLPQETKEETSSHKEVYKNYLNNCIKDLHNKSPKLKNLCDQNELCIVSALYDIASGQVEFFEGGN